MTGADWLIAGVVVMLVGAAFHRRGREQGKEEGQADAISKMFLTLALNGYTVEFTDKQLPNGTVPVVVVRDIHEPPDPVAPFRKWAEGED